MSVERSHLCPGAAWPAPPTFPQRPQSSPLPPLRPSLLGCGCFVFICPASCGVATVLFHPEQSGKASRTGRRFARGWDNLRREGNPSSCLNKVYVQRPLDIFFPRARGRRRCGPPTLRQSPRRRRRAVRVTKGQGVIALQSLQSAALLFFASYELSRHAGRAPEDEDCLLECGTWQRQHRFAVMSLPHHYTRKNDSAKSVSLLPGPPQHQPPPPNM